MASTYVKRSKNYLLSVEAVSNKRFSTLVSSSINTKVSMKERRTKTVGAKHEINYVLWGRFMRLI